MKLRVAGVSLVLTLLLIASQTSLTSGVREVSSVRQGAPAAARLDGLPPAVSELLRRTEWLRSRHEYGGACIRIAGTKVVYIDPVDLDDTQLARKADVVLITHPHPDHLSPDLLRRLQTASTSIVTVADCARRLAGWPRVTTVAPGQTLSVQGMPIEVVPAYNLPSGLHPRESGWAGFVVTLDGVRMYHSGDTSFVPEMGRLKQIDVAFLTVRSPYQMGGKELVQAAGAIKPRVAVPIHWQEAERADATYLAGHAPAGTRVMILQ